MVWGVDLTPCRRSEGVCCSLAASRMTDPALILAGFPGADAPASSLRSDAGITKQNHSLLAVGRWTVSGPRGPFCFIGMPVFLLSYSSSLLARRMGFHS